MKQIHNFPNNLLVGILVTIVALVLSLLGLMWAHSSSPHAFPLDDEFARYRIITLGQSYAVRFEKDGQAGGEVFVGRSRVDLSNYVGQPVHINGAYAPRPSNTQCVAGTCHLIFGSEANYAVVINIESIYKAAD